MPSPPPREIGLRQRKHKREKSREDKKGAASRERLVTNRELGTGQEKEVKEMQHQVTEKDQKTPAKGDMGQSITHSPPPAHGDKVLWVWTELWKGQGPRNPGWGYSLWASWLDGQGCQAWRKRRLTWGVGRDQLESTDSNQAKALGAITTTTSPGRRRQQPGASPGGVPDMGSPSPLGRWPLLGGVPWKLRNISEETPEPSPTIVPKGKQD